MTDVETDARFICVDCSVDTCASEEYYMVHDPLWAGAGMDPHGGMLCIGCLEARLGRQLTPADFPDYPINRDFFGYSPRLQQRLGLMQVAA